MATPQIILQGSAKETSKWIGLARKWADQTEKAGIRRKSWDLGSATVQVEHFGSGMSRVLIKERSFVSTPDDGDGDIRNQVLEQCGVWSSSRSGGFGTTTDFWDISKISVGATFDIAFEAYNEPDKFVVAYDGVTVLDTGWRGLEFYGTQYPDLFPGGVTYPGGGRVNGVFTRGPTDVFKVTVYGPLKTTVWIYSVRANCP